MAYIFLLLSITLSFLCYPCRELAEVQKTNAVSQSVAQEAAASAERSKQEELKLVLEHQSMSAHRDKETLLMQV